VTRCLDLGGVKYEKLSLPYRDQTLDAWFFKASDSEEKCPTIIAYNGFHSSMDWYVQTGMTKHLTDRGVNVLVFDHPGTGTARHHKDIHMTPFTEKSAKVAVDYLESRSDVDAARIGVLGASFGGYYAVRAAAFEKRFAYAYCWGGWYYWPPEEIFKDGDPDAETSSSIEMANLEDLFWVTGTKTRHELYDAITSFHLEKVCPEVTTPLYIIHGEDDAQLTPWHAEEVIKRAVNAPYKELHIVREGEGGTQHCHIDNFDSPVHLLADKIADTL
ncbi:MAG: alpha/beta fold hydrolase, partial [Pseudomonadota bacterium]